MEIFKSPCNASIKKINRGGDFPPLFTFDKNYFLIVYYIHRNKLIFIHEEETKMANAPTDLNFNFKKYIVKCRKIYSDKPSKEEEIAEFTANNILTAIFLVDSLVKSETDILTANGKYAKIFEVKERDLPSLEKGVICKKCIKFIKVNNTKETIFLSFTVVEKINKLTTVPCKFSDDDIINLINNSNNTLTESLRYDRHNKKLVFTISNIAFDICVELSIDSLRDIISHSYSTAYYTIFGYAYALNSRFKTTWDMRYIKEEKISAAVEIAKDYPFKCDPVARLNFEFEEKWLSDFIESIII